ncbi:MAG: GAF domain-containing protein [Helicobacteraceae bacterium]|jgi:GAF domain-containing protein|nr:GAF domain-containing protein [Helicobacteraceae bacterium]
MARNADDMQRELKPREMLEIIFEAIALISKEKEVDRILTPTADLGRELARADRCAIWLLSEDKTRLWTKVAHGISEISVSSDGGIVGRAIADNAPIIINDAYADERFNPEVDAKTGYVTRNIIALPIYDGEGEIIGVYQAINKTTKEGIFSEEDLDRLKLAAIYSGATLETAIAQKEIEETQKMWGDGRNGNGKKRD